MPRSGGAGGIIAIARSAGSSGRGRNGRVGAAIRRGVLKVPVWRGKKKDPWPNGCLAPCIVKTKAKLLALREEGASPDESTTSAVRP